MGRLGGRDQLVFGSLQRKVWSSPHWSSPRQLLGRRTAWHCEERELPRGPCCPTSLSQVCAPRAGLTANVVFLGHVAWRPSPVVLPSCWGDEECAHVGKKTQHSGTGGESYEADSAAPAAGQKAEVRGFLVSPLEDTSERTDGTVGDGEGEGRK